MENDMVMLKVLQISNHAADEGPRSLCLCTVVHFPHKMKTFYTNHQRVDVQIDGELGLHAIFHNPK